MKNWEYQITRYQVKDFKKGEEEEPTPSFYCDSKGQCFLHDTTSAAADLLRDAFNEEGHVGWELVQFGYHLGELMCVWKRAVD